MKAALIKRFGGPDVVSIGEARVRDLQLAEVMVRIEATGINPLDVKLLQATCNRFSRAIFPTYQAPMLGASHVRPGSDGPRGNA